ncbi:MAG: twin-arginine translocase subunit TatC [Pirellulales bacterium]|nr:twin-arginine translocase subunit TatC [Pirellulales bacterium]
MTFGEHLEELRTCLFKSLIALVAFSLVGLLMGGYVVEFIQAPLVKALSTYYETQAGEASPDGPAGLSEFVKKNHLLPQKVFVDPDEVICQLRQLDPERFGNLPVANRPDSKSANTPTLPAADVEDAKPKNIKDMIPLLLWHPTADDSRIRAKSLNPHEAFVIYVKASLLVGVLLASPYIFYQIWSFVAAGLYPHEQRYVRVFLPFSLGLFLAGAATAFFFVFEPVLNFLLAFNRSLGIDIEPRITEWLSFVLVLPLGFGISFQLPLVMLFLERIGVFDVQSYLSKWRVAILVIFVLAMFLTPADPYSMLLMAVPLIILYFLGIGLCKYMPCRRSPFDE